MPSNIQIKDEKVLGRPVDVTVAGNGSLLISDDEGNRTYRLRYAGGRLSARLAPGPEPR